MDSQFLLFKASAGSGKTFNLAIQYIALLMAKGEREYRHTLAVTFTNKATAEMKDRILAYLYDIWKGKAKAGTLKKIQDVLEEQYQTRLTDEELRERCRRALHAILHDYSQFCVSTIDAFFQTVLQNMAHELGLGARLQVDIDDKDVINLAVENLIDSLRKDGGESRRGVYPWIRQYIEQRLEDGNSWDVRGELKKVATLLFQEEYMRRSQDEDNEQAFNIPNITRFRRVLTEERKVLLSGLQQRGEEFERVLHNAGWDYETHLNYSRNVRNFVTAMKEGNTEANYGSQLQGLAADANKLLAAAYRKDTSLLPTAETLAQLLGEMGEHLQHITGRVNGINLALANLTPMGLLGVIDAEVTRLSNERNRFMLARTPIMLQRMIDSEDAPFVFERMGTRFHNIMIDEFQDTSRLQWENFRTLLLDNLSDGGLSMVVGDIKQSIYRWRNGDWRILHELGLHGHRGVPLVHHPLRDNFRSLGHIITFNNLFFPIAAAKLDRQTSTDAHLLSQLYDDVAQGIKREGDKGLVRIRLARPPKKSAKGDESETDWEELMLEDLCQQVRELHEKGLPYEKMTLLLRYNRFSQPLISYFAEHMPEVRLVSSEAFLLEGSEAVQMLVCALQVVDDVERDPVALYYLARHYQESVKHVKCDFTRAEDCLALLPETFTQHLEELRQVPLYDLCEELYQRLSLQEIPQQDAYIFTFLDELTNYLRDNPSDIPSFLQYWDERMHNIPIPSSEVEGIRIYTIHKSKGLAFHTVLMPYAEWAIEKDRPQDLYWCLPSEAPLNEMGTLPVRLTSEKVKGSAFETAYKEEHENRRADELNDLYVAFTRAEDNLFVWGTSHKALEPEKTDETVADLMSACLEEMPELTRQEECDGQIVTYTLGLSPSLEIEEEETTETVNIAMQTFPSTISFRQSNQAEEFVRRMSDEEEDEEEERQASYIRQGKLLHYIFSKIETEDDIDRLTSQFAQQGIFATEKQLRQARDLAHRGLKNEKVREWFSGKYELFNECNILVPDEENGKMVVRRPDRVMIGPDRIVVVDFKFGRPINDHKEQVEDYVRILREMHPDKQVEGWLWYVYKNTLIKS